MLLYSFKLGLKINNEHPPPLGHRNFAGCGSHCDCWDSSDVENDIFFIVIISAVSVALALRVHGDHYRLQVGGGGCLPTSSAPRTLKLTGFIDICYLSSYAKWFIFEINSSKIRVYGYLIILCSLNWKIKRRWSSNPCHQNCAPSEPAT